MGTIPSWARVGQKVVAIDVGFGPINWSVTGLTKGTVYTVALIQWSDALDGFLIRIDEMRGRFGLYRFRPLITRSQEQDVSRFRKHLRPKRTRTDAFVKIPHHGTIGE